MVLARRDVLAHHPADRLCTLLVEVTFVRPGLQRQPFLAWLAAAPGPDGRAAVPRYRGGSSVRIGAAVNRVRHHPVDRRVAWSTPGGLAIAAAGRQVEAVLAEPQK